MGLGFSFFWWPHPLASLFLLMQIWALYCYVHLRRCPLFSWGCNSGLWKPDTNASTEAALPWETHQVISKFWIIVHSSQSTITVFCTDRKLLCEHEYEEKKLQHDFPKMRGDQRPFRTFPKYSSVLETPSVPQVGRKVVPYCFFPGLFELMIFYLTLLLSITRPLICSKTSSQWEFTT